MYVFFIGVVSESVSIYPKDPKGHSFPTCSSYLAQYVSRTHEYNILTVLANNKQKIQVLCMNNETSF